MFKNSSYKRTLIILIIQMLLFGSEKENKGKSSGVARRPNITGNSLYGKITSLGKNKMDHLTA